MKLIKECTELGNNIFLKNNDKSVVLSYLNDGNLLISLHDKINRNHSSFIIDNESDYIYRLFEQLYNEVEDMNIYNMTCFNNDNVNNSIYNELFKNNVITWYSDDNNNNVIKISKYEDYFLLDFYNLNNRENKKSISINFKGNGSKYEPFNIIFMRLFNKMNRLDSNLVNDNNNHKKLVKKVI